MDGGHVAALLCPPYKTEHVSSISRHTLPEVCIWFAPKYEGAGKTGCVPHPRSHVLFAHGKEVHTGIQVRRKHPGLPCAMALRLASCSSRRTALLPPSPALLIADLAPAPRRQNHTTSPYASSAIVYRAINVHRISPRVRDDGQRPSSSSKTSGVMPLICARTEAEYFWFAGLT